MGSRVTSASRRACLVKGMDGEKPVIGEYSSGNEYEMCRFNSADRLILNEPFWKVLQKKTQASFEVAPTC